MENSTQQKSLCLSCGICCNGTLFSNVPLKPRDDLQTLEKYGIEILINGEKKSFKQGCVKFENQCCQIYPDRPTNCRKYRCELLKKFESGDVSWSEVREKIVRVQHLAENLEREISKNIPEHAGLSVPALLRVAPEGREMFADPKLLSKWADVMMNLAALLDCLQNYFYSPDKHKNPAKILEETVGQLFENL